MDIRTLKQDSYNRLAKDRPEVLEKNRGYGIVSITIDTLTYAIPLRSNMNHSSGFKTISMKRGKKLIWNGLDYSKALIVQQSDIESTAFKLREQKEFDKIQSNKSKIQSEFEKYVTAYRESVEKGTSTKDPRFKFSTLQYFHAELGI
jgi:protein AbiQ